MGLVRGLLGLILAILLAAFAVANRQAVDVAWSPVHPPLHAPLYVIALGLLALGFLLGGFAAWLNSVPVRWEKKRQSRRIKSLEKELGKEQERKDPVPALTETVVQDMAALPPADTDQGKKAAG